jgi:sarcosine oxidase subunit alpha
MLQETGVVYDDGVVMRIDENRFVVSCSSAHVAGVAARLQEWRLDRFDRKRVAIHDATEQWATICLTGPLSRKLAERLPLAVDLTDAGLPHMAFASGAYEGGPARVARVSFTGERSYEISVPASKASSLLERILQEGVALDAFMLGLEAILLLRAEKGYIIVGKDTDGTTMPHDIGFPGPREKRTDDYAGSRSLFTEAASAGSRRRLVGLAAEGAVPIPAGAHAVAFDGGRKRSAGYVTSSYFSPTLNAPIALALVECGAGDADGRLAIQHLGEQRHARIVDPCFLDPSGERLNA